MGWVVAIVAAFLLYKSGALANLNLGALLSPSGVPTTATGTVQAPVATTTVAPTYQAGLTQTSQEVAGGLQAGVASTKVAVSSLQTAGDITSSTAQAVGTAIPIIGAAVSVIAGVLIAASQKRAKEAQNENQAVGAAISQGYDPALRQANAYYNSTGDANGTNQLFTQIMANYWSEVTPVIQPGRNGCQGGALPWRGNAGNQDCSGDWGAACCAGYADLIPGIQGAQSAIAINQKTGAPSVSIVPTVYPSKYGGISRPSYTLTWSAPA